MLLRLPTYHEEIEAQIKAARQLANDLGEDAQVDPDLLRVDLPTLTLLADACRNPKDPKGPPMFGTPRMMARETTSEEQLELLHQLNGAKAARAGVKSSEEDLEMGLTALAECETEGDAYKLLAAFDHERMVRLCWTMARATRAMVDDGVVFDDDDGDASDVLG